MKRCAACYWFELGDNPTAATAAKLGKEGFCFFNPPVPALIPAVGSAIQRQGPQMNVAHIGMVPTTFENRRCKEWRTKDDAASAISRQQAVNG